MELIKELLRLVLLGAVSYLLTDSVLTNLFAGLKDPTLKSQVVLGLTGLLKATDRWLHETKLAQKGLVRF